MQLLKALPRQPFIGLALAASIGILVADFAPNHSPGLGIALAILASTALLSRNSFATYALVATGFFILHSLSRSDSPAVRLARTLGEKTSPRQRSWIRSERTENFAKWFGFVPFARGIH